MEVCVLDLNGHSVRKRINNFKISVIFLLGYTKNDKKKKIRSVKTIFKKKQVKEKWVKLVFRFILV